MKLGYPCVNWTLKANANKTFRLASYSEPRLIETIEHNLSSLKKILEWNIKNGFLFFRISSDTIPFASHPINKFNWQKYFNPQLKELGKIIKNNGLRISMHPDQFVLINSIDQNIFKKSVADLKYHCDLLDEMGLDSSAKIQIHIGGIYGDKASAIKRFVEKYQILAPSIKKRLVIENDDRLFSLQDCLRINSEVGIPILFDNFHHECLNEGETVREGFLAAQKTWGPQDGVIMVDFSHQQPLARKGKHAQTINPDLFSAFLRETDDHDMDIMLEIKDKEISAEKVKGLMLTNNFFSSVH